MTASTLIQRLLVPALGVLLTCVLLWQSGQLGSPAPTPGPRDSPGAERGHERGRVVAEGRVVAYPGAEVVVGSEIAGLIVKLPVEEGTAVRKGDLIAELRSDDLRASLGEALARISETEVDIEFYKRELQRMERLRTRDAGTQAEIDNRRWQLDAAAARRGAARAARDRYEALIAKTRITAPIAGVVVDRHAHPGETIEPTSRLVALADLTRIRVEAEVDEFDAGKVALGAEAKVLAEGYPGVSWRGTVEEIPHVVVGRRIRPQDPGRPTDSRVLLVKIALEKPTLLKLGQRVEVEIQVPVNRNSL